MTRDTGLYPWKIRCWKEIRAIKPDVYACRQICYALCNHKKMHHIQAVPTVNLLIILTQVYYTLGTIHDALVNKNITWSSIKKEA